MSLNILRRYSRGQMLGVLAHVVGIVILLVLPAMLASYSRPGPGPRNALAFFKSAMYVLVFYANYFYLVGASLRHRHSVLRLVVQNVLLCLVVLVVIQVGAHYIMQHYFPGPPHPHHTPAHPWVIQLSWVMHDVVMLVLTIGLAITLRLMGRWTRMERETRELEALRRENELKNLKSQLNPHFLFNSLNTIYALIAITPEQAQEAVHELSSMMRYVLYQSADKEVALKGDFDFVNSYLSLMRQRLSHPELLSATVSLPESVAHAGIAPLLFITLIENVFKHADTSKPMTITLQAQATGEVTCTTVNALRREPSAESPGIGLDNLRRRLKLLYGHAATLSTTAADGLYKASLNIQLPIPEHPHA